METFRSANHFSVSLDYVDLKGGLRSLSLVVANEAEAVNCLREAWNANLLWYFKLYLKNPDSLSKIREIPWSLDLLHRALALPRLQDRIDKLQGNISHYKGEVLENFISPSYRMEANIEKLAECSTKSQALAAVRDELIDELESHGIRTSELLDSERTKSLEFVVTAAKTLHQIQNDEPVDISIAISRSHRVEAKDFLKSLSEVPGIFRGANQSGFIPAVEASMEFSS